MPPAPAGRARQRRAPPPAKPSRPAPASPPAPSRAVRRGGWHWLRWPLLIGIWGAVALALLLLVFAWDLPRPDSLPAATRRPSVTLLAADGSMLATQGDLYGETVRLRDLPAHLPAALMAVEDRRFRSHFGIDPWGLARAALANWRAGEVVQGGSTLTQQLAKNLFLTPERNFRRKVQEALLALWLERRFTKDQLLEIYLNRVYLGAGAYGVDAASRLFFGIPARRLALWQSALLAGLPKAPSRYNPRAAPDLAVARAAEVLEAMLDNHAITEQQRDAELSRMRLPPPGSRQAGWFADWALEDLAEAFPGNADLTLRATLDARLQAAVEARLEALLAGPGARAGVSPGRGAGDGCRLGRHPRHGRRPGLPRQPVQPRHQRPPPARLRLQAGRTSSPRWNMAWRRTTSSPTRRSASAAGRPATAPGARAARSPWRRRWPTRSIPPASGCC